MSGKLLEFLQRWLITTVGVLAAANLVRGISYDTAGALFTASLLLGLLNAFVRPLLLALSFAFVILTLGLGILVINAALLLGVGHLVKGFHVAGFGSAFLGGLVISLVSLVANALLGRGPRVRVQGPDRKNPGRRGDDDGQGPVIDV